MMNQSNNDLNEQKKQEEKININQNFIFFIFLLFAILTGILYFSINKENSLYTPVDKDYSFYQFSDDISKSDIEENTFKLLLSKEDSILINKKGVVLVLNYILVKEQSHTVTFFVDINKIIDGSYHISLSESYINGLKSDEKSWSNDSIHSITSFFITLTLQALMMSTQLT